MADRPKRTAVSLDARTDATLAKLARLQRRPKATIAADLLSEMQPALERIAKLLEAAITNRSRLPAEAAGRMEALADLLGDVATVSLGRLEAAVSPPADLPPATGGRSGRRRQH